MRNWLIILIVLLLSGCGGGGVPIGATSANAYLDDVVLSDGLLDQEFRSNIDTYTAAVTNDVTTLRLSPTSADDGATVYVNGSLVGSGRFSNQIPLQVGDNFVRIKVVAPDEVTTRNYHFTILREAGRNSNLATLELSDGSLNEFFIPNILSYTANVSFDVDKIAVIPSVEQSTASITVNGILISSGSLSQYIPLFVGSNVIAVEVTAQDGRNQQIYTITVTRATQAAASNDATLSDLQLTTGAMDQAFDPATFLYTQTVTADTAQVSVTATTNHSGATVKINNVATTSGSASAPIALAAGADTVIPIQVVAEDGKTTRNYQVTITRNVNSDSTLANLVPSSGTLSPGFSSDVNSYSMTVANDVTSLSLTPTATDSLASILVNGSAATSGQSSSAIALAVGSNQIVTVVTAQDGSSQKTYTLNVTRQGSGNVDLSALAISSGSLSPTFSSSTLEYDVSVTNGTTDITVTPTASDGTVTIKVNGATVASGATSAALPLSVGANDITVSVTSSDAQTSQDYVLHVTRAGINADLSSLTPSTGSLSPSFTAGTISYTLSVGNATSQISFTPVVTDAGSSVTVDGSATTSGNASAPVTLTVGDNPIDIVVTASDLSTKTYTVTVNRTGASNADLSALTLSAGSLSPAFDATKISYSAEVASAVSSIDITATVADSNASLKTNNDGGTVSGVATTVSLVEGVNSIPVVVTAEDGVTQKTYTLNITRTAANNADLGNLVTSEGVLNPTFATNVTSYTISLPNNISSLTFTPTTAVQAATVSVDGQAVVSGNASQTINLSVGSNLINVDVVAEDGNTSKTYVVDAQRDASNDASLSALSLSEAGISPAFGPAITAYTLSVANAITELTVTPTANHSGATITTTVNGVSNATNPISLNVGNNSISIQVTAEDGTTIQNYSIVVTRDPSSNPDLVSLVLSAGTLSPVFDSATNSYTAEVNNSVTGVTVTATGVTPLGSLKVNNISATSGSPSQSMALAVGNNTITIDTISEDDSATNSYSVVVTRLPPSSVNADLVDLKLSVGKLDQTFQTASRNYTASFGYLVSEVQVIATTDQQDATLTVNGVSATSGQPSQAIALTEGGDTSIEIVVTGSDGTTTQTYAINVSRDALANFAQQAYVKASNTGGGDKFGSNVALSGDTLVVGAPEEGGSASSDGIPGSADNNSATNAGAVYVFVRDGTGNWSQQAFLKPASVEGNDYFGTDVAIDGDVLVATSIGEDSNATGVNGNEYDNQNSNSGAAYVYERVNGVWSKTAYLKPAINNKSFIYLFGSSVDISGDTIVVGSASDDGLDSGVQNSSTGGATSWGVSTSNIGSATVFVRSGDSWVQQAYIKADNPSEGDEFGHDVAIDGDTIVIGAALEDTSNTNSGAAYVFVRNTGIWSQQARLKAVTGLNGDMRFGSGVDVSGETIVVGAYKQDAPPTYDSGAVYVFVRANNVWSEQAVLKATVPQTADWLGFYVHIDGDTVVTGARHEDGAGLGVNSDATSNGLVDSGAGYVFTRSNGVWAQRYYLKASNTGSYDHFCRLNAIDGDTVVCATFFEASSSTGINGADNNNAGSSGAVYVFQ